MARQNVQLKHQIDALQKQLTEAQSASDFQSNLRRIENLNQDNFQSFLESDSSNLGSLNGGLYLPVASTITQSATSIGKFARQWG